MNKEKIYHLSHIDADGFGCNVVLDLFSENDSNKCYGFSLNNIQSYSANYGYLEKQVFNIIEDMKNDDLEVKKLLLITDLNIKE